MQKTPKNSRFNHLQIWTELVGLLIMLMELLWVTAWYVALSTNWANDWLVALALGCVLLCSHYLARLLNNSKWRMVIRVVVFASWIFACLMISLRILVYHGEVISFGELFTRPAHALLEFNELREFWHLLAIILLVWRAVSIARRVQDIYDAIASFQFGLLSILLYGMVYNRMFPARVAFFLYAFIFIGLIGMSVARIARLSDLRGGRLPPFKLNWSLGLLAASLMVIFIALLASRVIDLKIATIFTTILFYLLIAFAAVSLLLLIPLLLFLIWISPLIQRFLAVVMGSDVLGPLRGLLAQFAGLAKSSLFDGIFSYINYVKPLVPWLILLGVILIILARLRWRQWKRKLASEENLIPLPAFVNWTLLKAFMRGRRDRRLGRAGQLLASAHIRRIYMRLMILCDDLGKSRPKAVTPLEFVPQLEQLFPGESEGLLLITNAYQKVRYGELPEKPQEVLDVIAVWERLRSYGRHLKDERKHYTRRRGLKREIRDEK